MDSEGVQSSPNSFEMNNDSAEGASGDMTEEAIEVPMENDVLCGRGGSINSHKGNEQFRLLVEKRKRVYLTARFKREKRLIASSIVSEIRGMDPPGRFLARKGNKDSGVWYVISEEKARDKTSQALRENAPSIRAEIETEINEQRAEMMRKEDADISLKPLPTYSPHPPHAGLPYYQQAPPPPPPHSHQSYWDWYHHYYGYPPPQMPSHHPPHGSPPAATMPGAHPPPPHAAASYWGMSVVPTTGREKTGEEFKDDGMQDIVSQEEEDRLLAMELQQQEKAALFEARKAKYKHTLANRSNAYVNLGSQHRSPHAVAPPAAAKPQPKHIRRDPMAYESMDSSDMTQEQLDHRLAVALQEQEDSALRHHLQASRDSSRKTSRSNAYSLATRVSRDAVMSADNSNSYGSFEHLVPSSFVAWVSSDSGLKPKAARRRSVQFKDDEPMGSHVVPSPGNLQRQSSAASADRPLQPQAEQNTSLLSQVAHHIMGSWEHGGSKQSRRGSLQHSLASSHDDMEAEGLEVQLRDPRDETSMPPPSPRVQIDWPSRPGNGNSWIPETLHVAWASGTNNSLSGGSTGHPGISPVNSLEMDGSANIGSVGGGSLCQLFDQDESLQRALREVPSWERSMRSKSPLSIASVEDSDISLIRVREMKLFRSAAPHIRSSGSGEMDWEDQPEED